MYSLFSHHPEEDAIDPSWLALFRGWAALRAATDFLLKCVWIAQDAGPVSAWPTRDSFSSLTLADLC